MRKVFNALVHKKERRSFFIVFWIIWLLSWSSAVFGTNYYVSSSVGDDKNDGLSPQTAWKTFENFTYPARTVTLAGGDTLFMKRGDVWYDQLAMIHTSGSDGKHVVVTDYGDHSKRPHIIGQLDNSKWELHSKNETSTVWRYYVAHRGYINTAVDKDKQRRQYHIQQF